MTETVKKEEPILNNVDGQEAPLLDADNDIEYPEFSENLNIDVVAMQKAILASELEKRLDGLDEAVETARRLNVDNASETSERLPFDDANNFSQRQEETLKNLERVQKMQEEGNKLAQIANRRMRRSAWMAIGGLSLGALFCAASFLTGMVRDIQIVHDKKRLAAPLVHVDNQRAVYKNLHGTDIPLKTRIVYDVWKRGISYGCIMPALAETKVEFETTLSPNKEMWSVEEKETHDWLNGCILDIQTKKRAHKSVIEEVGNHLLNFTAAGRTVTRQNVPMLLKRESAVNQMS